MCPVIAITTPADIIVSVGSAETVASTTPPRNARGAVSGGPVPTLLHGHDQQVQELLFTTDSRWLVTAGADNTARKWDLSAPDPSSSNVARMSCMHSIPSVRALTRRASRG